MGITERRNRDREKMRKRILDTAMKLFLADGYESVSMRRIADMIEYSPATIYLYYKSKDAIFYELHDIGFEKLYKKQSLAYSFKDPWKRLEKHGKAYIDFALGNPRYYELMFIMEAPEKDFSKKDEGDIGYRSFDFLVQNIRDCMDQGYLKKTDASVAAFSFWSLIHGIVSLVLRGKAVMFEEGQMEAVARDSLKYVMNSIRNK